VVEDNAPIWMKRQWEIMLEIMKDMTCTMIWMGGPIAAYSCMDGPSILRFWDLGYESSIGLLEIASGTNVGFNEEVELGS
jgi:hypothetical protein